MSRLSDRINRAPPGSRLRSILFEDTSSSEEEEDQEDEWSENNDGVENAWKSIDRKKESIEQQGHATRMSPRRHNERSTHDIIGAAQSDITRPKKAPSPPVETLRNNYSFDNPQLQTNDVQRVTSDNKRPVARVSLSPAPEKSRMRKSISALEALAPPPAVDLKPLKKRKVEDLVTHQCDPKTTKNTTVSRDERSRESINCSETREKAMLRAVNEKNLKRVAPGAKEEKIQNLKPSAEKKINQELGTFETSNVKGNTDNACAKVLPGEKLTSGSSLESKWSESERSTPNQIDQLSKTVKGASKQNHITNVGKGSEPKKKKKKRTFQDQVVAEILFSCKAYSLKTLASTLNSTENALNHLMLSLLDKKIVFKKEFTSKSGKTREIYWANQDSDAKEVLKLIPNANEVVVSKQELASLHQLDKDIAKDMAFLTQKLSNEEIDTQLLNLEAAMTNHKAEITKIHERIRHFKNNPNFQPPHRGGFRVRCPPKTPAQLAKERCPRRLKMRINALRAHWKSRKEKCTDFIDQLSDAMEKKPKDIIKLLDLETDEMEGVKIPTKYVIEN